MTNKTAKQRFGKGNLIEELLQFSDKIAKAAGVRLDHGYSECRPKTGTLTLKQPTTKNNEVYRLTSKEIDALIVKSVEYGRATVTRDLATWVDEGRFGVTGIEKGEAP